MNKTETLLSLAMALATVFVGNSPALAHGKGLYSTEAEAQARADDIGCTSVHQNNGKWMPCEDERELHQQLRKQ
jgi:hypothetical protein